MAVDQPTQDMIAEMKQNAENMRAVTLASNEIQTMLGMAQVQSQTIQTGVGAAKAASRPS